ERGLGFIAHYAVGHVEIDGFHRRRVALYDLVATKCTVLEGREIWRASDEADVRRELSLEHLASESQVAALVLVADGIANERTIQPGRQLGSEVAHLVGVRHQHQLGLLL